MPDFIATATVDSTGAASITNIPIPSGKEWVFQQIAVATLPRATGSGCVATLYRNGQVVSTTNQGGGGSAGGQPYYRFTAADHFQCAWTGAPVGAQAQLTVSYTEHVVGQASPSNTGIV